MKNIKSTKYQLEQEQKKRKEKEDRIESEKQDIQQEKYEQKEKRHHKIQEGLRLSYAAYYDFHIAKEYLEDHGFTDFIPISSWVGTQGFCCLRDRKACLVFRGTDSLLDGIVDLLFSPWYRPATHFGFGRSWRSVREDVRQWLADHKGSFDSIALYGHSLGGAIAHVAALELATDDENEYDIAEVVTFGAPRSSFLSTGEYYDNFQLKTEPEKTLRSVTLRVVNKLDLISKVPFPWMGYRHVGQLVYLSADGQVCYDKKAYFRQKNEGFLEPVFRFLEQENSALHDPSVTLLPKMYNPPSTVRNQDKQKNLGKRLLYMYHKMELFTPVLHAIAQGLFILIAPFILLFGSLLYLIRSSSSHLKLGYAIYFFKPLSPFEYGIEVHENLETLKNQTDTRWYSKVLTGIVQIVKAILVIALAIGVIYLCYWLFIHWFWPNFLDLIVNLFNSQTSGS